MIERKSSLFVRHDVRVKLIFSQSIEYATLTWYVFFSKKNSHINDFKLILSDQKLRGANLTLKKTTNDKVFFLVLRSVRVLHTLNFVLERKQKLDFRWLCSKTSYHSLNYGLLSFTDYGSWNYEKFSVFPVCSLLAFKRKISYFLLRTKFILHIYIKTRNKPLVVKVPWLSCNSV